MVAKEGWRNNTATFKPSAAPSTPAATATASARDAVAAAVASHSRRGCDLALRVVRHDHWHWQEAAAAAPTGS